MTPWTEVVPGLWRSSYVTPTKLTSNSFALALKGGELAVVSPPSGADDAFFAATDALGKVTALVAPNSGHDLGQAPWQARYPAATIHAPEATAKAIAKAKPKLRAIEPLTALASRLPDTTKLSDLAGTSSGSTVLSVEAGGRRVLVVDEPISNSPTLIGPAPVRFVFWLTGSGPGIARNKLWWMIFCKDKPGYARALLGELDRVQPTTIFPLHGEAIEGEGVASVRALLQPLAG